MNRDNSHAESTVFSWQPEEMTALLEACEREGVFELLKKYAPEKGKILESGCGAARYVRFLKDRGYTTVGLEISPETVSMVKNVWPDLDVVCGDAAASPFADDEFDAVLSLGVVEHWPEGPEKPLADIHRVLKPGGRAIITVPCLNTVRRIKAALWIPEIFRLPRLVKSKLIGDGDVRVHRLRADSKYAVHPAIGSFFEYRMTPAQFADEVKRIGFVIDEHIPMGRMDGLYHDLNPFGLLVKFENWRFAPTRFGEFINRRLSGYNFFHCHMQGIVAQKPLP